MATSDSINWLRVRDQDLAGKVAVVTGASKGIGRATALNLASRGCAVLGTCSSLETVPQIESLAESISTIYRTHSSPGPKIVGIAASILSPDCATLIADQLKANFGGRIDILVLNAAVFGFNSIGSGDVALIQKFCLGNIQTSVLIVDELVKRRMFRVQSRIVLVSSERSQNTASNLLLYAATKSAGEALARGWADEFGGHNPELDFMSGTTANSIFVGLTNTDAFKKFPPEVAADIEAKFVAAQSLPRFAGPEDVADVIGLICSQEARWITGSAVSANAGGFKIC